jgi:hypothetical protein
LWLDSHSFIGPTRAREARASIDPAVVHLVTDERRSSTNSSRSATPLVPDGNRISFVTRFVTPRLIQHLEPASTMSREKPAKPPFFVAANWHTGC